MTKSPFSGLFSFLGSNTKLSTHAHFSGGENTTDFTGQASTSALGIDPLRHRGESTFHTDFRVE